MECELHTWALESPRDPGGLESVPESPGGALMAVETEKYSFAVEESSVACSDASFVHRRTTTLEEGTEVPEPPTFSEDFKVSLAVPTFAAMSAMRLMELKSGGSIITFEPKVPVVKLTPNAYTLVIASPSAWAILPMFIVSIAQTGVLLSMGLRSHSYFFSDGKWIQPMSGSFALASIKIFASFLIIFEIADEFQQAGMIFRLLIHEPRVTLSYWQRKRAWYAVGTQYVTALMVLVFALHLILTSIKITDPLWKAYYATMTMQFDNLMSKFLLYILNPPNLTWKFSLPDIDEVTASLATTMRRESKFIKRGYRYDFVFIVMPGICALTIVCMSIALDVCPLTYVLFGVVTNLHPIQMITSMYGLPDDCCEVYTALTPDRAYVHVSVPCLSDFGPLDGSEPPDIAWVLWPVEKDPPTSLQVLLGGGEGYFGRHGKKASKFEDSMSHWLDNHGYEKEVYDAMLNETGTVGLYRKSFAYTAEWGIEDLPMLGTFVIYATGYNPTTLALSPFPLKSSMLSFMGGVKCPPECEDCSTKGICHTCRLGCRLNHQTNECEKCSENCEYCLVAGPGKCSVNSCSEGYGYAGSLCWPCKSANCNCNVPLEEYGPNERVYDSDGNIVDPSAVAIEGGSLPCQACESGHGLKEGVCFPCHDENCEDCTLSGTHSLRCDQCAVGFGAMNKNAGSDAETYETVCIQCPANCEKCEVETQSSVQVVYPDGLGPPNLYCSRCRERHALSEGACLECPLNCKKCEHPDACDPDECEEGHGTQREGLNKWQRISFNSRPPACAKCIDSCLVCEMEPTKCDTCMHGYGMTLSSTCLQCSAHCAECRTSEECSECEEGFVLSASVEEGSTCHSCSDQCKQCDTAGPLKCDECQAGWTPVKGVCMPCSELGCIRCEPGKIYKCCEWDDGTTVDSEDCEVLASIASASPRMFG